MAMSTEEVADLTAGYKLLSADELRAQLGSSEEEDALINQVLGEGKSVETKRGKELQADAEDDSDDEEEAKPAPEAKKAAPPDDDDDDDDDADDAAPEAAATKKAEGDAATTSEPAVEEGAADDAGQVNDVSAEVPPLDLGFIEAKFNENLAKLDETKAESFQKLMDGEIDAKAYSKAESDYMRQRDELRERKTQEAEWFTSVHAFKLEVARTMGINYDLDTEKGTALHEWVTRLADKPENQDRDGRWFLEQAHKKVLTEFDIAPVSAKPAAKPVEKPTETPVAAKKVAAKTGRAPDLSNIPPTIGNLPAAAESDASDSGEFGHLDKLSGMAYETALARLSADQKARYEAM